MEKTQLNRMEKKMDRILELLEGKELSTSIAIDDKKVTGFITVPAKSFAYKKL